MKPFVLQPGRIKCEVMGCRRTAKAEPDNPRLRIICGKCWRANSSAEERRAWSKFHREAVMLDDKLGAMHDAGMEVPADLAARYARCAAGAHRQWEAIVERANGAATGL